MRQDAAGARRRNRRRRRTLVPAPGLGACGCDSRLCLAAAGRALQHDGVLPQPRRLVRAPMDARPSSSRWPARFLHALWNAAITASANPCQAMTAQMIAAAVLALLGLMWAVPPPLAVWPRRAALTRPNSQLRGLRTFLTEEMKMRTKQTAP